MILHEDLNRESVEILTSKMKDIVEQAEHTLKASQAKILATHPDELYALQLECFAINAGVKCYKNILNTLLNPESVAKELDLLDKKGA